MGIGERLKQIRNIEKLSQKEFGDLLDISSGAIGNYEVETRELPDNLKIKLKEKYNINLHWLVTGEGNMFLNENNCQEVYLQKDQRIVKENVYDGGVVFIDSSNKSFISFFTFDCGYIILSLPN